MGMYYPKGHKFDVDGDTGIDCSGDRPITKQEFKQDCDVNLIIKRCLKEGFSPDYGAIRGAFADVSAIGDFQTLRNQVVEAEQAFMELPADLRSRFDNDPAKLIAFVSDDANRPEAEKLGLVEPKKEVKPPLSSTDSKGQPVEKSATPASSPGSAA